jgi:hypothetical protein
MFALVVDKTVSGAGMALHKAESNIAQKDKKQTAEVDSRLG